MSDSRDLDLPVVGQATKDQPPDDTPSCSPAVYVTNEEASLVAGMRSLHERAVALRGRIAKCTDDDRRTMLEAELAELRARRTELAKRREQAYRHKMVMLGHLPPDALLE